MKHQQKGEINMQVKKLERDNISANDLRDWFILINNQLEIAKSWLQKGDETEDIFAKFFFYFTGFNSIYFLWGKIDNPHLRSERKHINNLLKKLDGLKAQKILDKIKTSVDYFIQRPPIIQMNKRTKRKQYTGDDSKGRKLKNLLQKNNISASERLIAMGQILYLVRCNLFHGSKTQSGVDKEIVKNSIEPLKVILKEAISLTEQQCTWGR